MAGVTGLEPAASGVTGRRSNQLSYTPYRAVTTAGGDPQHVRPCILGVKAAWVTGCKMNCGEMPLSGSHRTAAMKSGAFSSSVRKRSQTGFVVEWWAVTGSNCRHPRCKRGALPTELTARQIGNVKSEALEQDRCPAKGTIGPNCHFQLKRRSPAHARPRPNLPEGLSATPYALTASFRALPARNLGTREAGIWTSAPVRGLRPTEAFRCAT